MAQTRPELSTLNWVTSGRASLQASPLVRSWLTRSGGTDSVAHAARRLAAPRRRARPRQDMARAGRPSARYLPASRDRLRGGGADAHARDPVRAAGRAAAPRLEKQQPLVVGDRA